MSSPRDEDAASQGNAPSSSGESAQSIPAAGSNEEPRASEGGISAEGLSRDLARGPGGTEAPSQSTGSTGPRTRGRTDLGPFRALNVAANNGDLFRAPLAGASLSDGATTFLARSRGETGYALFIANQNGAVRILDQGADLVAPADADARGEDVFVADRAALGGDGAVLRISSKTGRLDSALARGFRPASVTVDSFDGVYFSGIDPDTGAPGVFHTSIGGGSVDRIFVGAPLVDPGGIALLRDGRVLVADTSHARSSQGAVYILQEGRAHLFVGGFATGFPAGIAVTLDESWLIASGQGADGLDKIFIFDMATRHRRVIEAEFSSAQSSSGGLHRAADRDTFIWSSGTFNGGTVYRLER